ncbi:MAG TPA: FHA domain-containing protein [Hyphomicrobiaceae bacterium]|nr:FHA domain-containing protein [Hyphomicrobiaceae bacterium]
MVFQTARLVLGTCLFLGLAALGAAIVLSPELGVVAEELALEAWIGARATVSAAYAKSPAMVISLSVALALPVAAVSADIAHRMTRRRQLRGASLRRSPRGDILTSRVPRGAWIEVDGEQGRRHLIEREILSIGREIDCDVTLDDPALAETHLVIRRDVDGRFLAVDLSGQGIGINGKLQHRAEIGDGDRISLGACRLTMVVSAQPQGR